MKLKFTTLQHLWILFGLQVLVLIVLLAAFAWCQSHLSNIANNIQRSDNKLPTIRQRINDEQDPEWLRKEALTLLDNMASQSGNVRGMLMASGEILKTFCLGLLVITAWLGICLYRLQRQSQKDVSVPSV